MALIICPECKKEVSDKAEICIHCGFPLKKDLNYDDVPMFFEIKLLDFRNNKYKAIALVREIAGIVLPEAKALVDNNATPIIVSGLCREDAEKVKNIFDSNDISVCIEPDEVSTEQRMVYFDSNNKIVKKTKNDNVETYYGNPSVLRCPSCGSMDVKQGNILGNKCKICGNKWR